MQQQGADSSPGRSSAAKQAKQSSAAAAGARAAGAGSGTGTTAPAAPTRYALPAFSGGGFTLNEPWSELMDEEDEEREREAAARKAAGKLTPTPAPASIRCRQRRSASLEQRHIGEAQPAQCARHLAESGNGSDPLQLLGWPLHRGSVGPLVSPPHECSILYHYHCFAMSVSVPPSPVPPQPDAHALRLTAFHLEWDYSRVLGLAKTKLRRALRCMREHAFMLPRHVLTHMSCKMLEIFE